ncbi:hypothetical protein PbJCM13498_10880 [Prolixibacter bellariivorans]|uniref:Carboxypeptidase-like regulatory domain-containing protein n=1 Tax=Prolixibacter bellariivorans TaxID=314319 RepID=A0A5M4AWC9_9BACT|nr:carboxypeptidase-like regulatory domain-containing protein [Prolixibacter bellariivorans]GET32225.1 hypothetical protein PbJCM13498_10880 [Prolixibacter bellariivorans]
MKKKSIILTILILVGTHLTGVAQENKTDGKQPIFVTGVVFDRKEMKPLPETVFLINHRHGATTDANGKFSFWGAPGDTITARYVGYKEVDMVVPDTLSASEYLMGVFMSPDTVQIKEVVIFPRNYNLMSEMKQLPVDERMLQNAQQNVDMGTVQGLTQAPKTYDADMNARNTMRKYQMEAEYKGMKVNPGNSLSISTSALGPLNFLYGKPILHKGKLKKQIISSNEQDVVVGRYQAYLAKKWKKYDERKKEKQKEVNPN